MKVTNRGIYKEGLSCDFLHPNQDCQEHCSSVSCTNRSTCPFRHPNRCKFWSRGHCWGGQQCVYLHNAEDFNIQNIVSDNKDINELEDDDVSEVLDKNSLELNEKSWAETDPYTDPIGKL